MAYRKLNRASDQRKAILRNLTSALLWNGKIVTTEARAKEVRSIAEKLITVAVKEHKNTVEVKKTVNGESKSFTNDSASRLHARRKALSYLYDFKEERKEDETLSEYKDRTKKSKHAVVNKLFDEIAPKYEGRPGGYTRIVKMGPRRGDAAEMAILELG